MGELDPAGGEVLLEFCPCRAHLVGLSERVKTLLGRSAWKAAALLARHARDCKTRTQRAAEETLVGVVRLRGQRTPGPAAAMAAAVCSSLLSISLAGGLVARERWPRTGTLLAAASTSRAGRPLTAFRVSAGFWPQGQCRTSYTAREVRSVKASSRSAIVPTRQKPCADGGSGCTHPGAATRRLAHAPEGSLPISEGMEVLISLQYANGRIHEATYTTSEKLGLDAEFDLYGRCWRVVGITKTRRARGDTPRMLCVSTGAASRLPPASASRP